MEEKNKLEEIENLAEDLDKNLEDLTSFEQDKSKSSSILSMNILSEFIASLFLGGSIGYGLDHWLKTKPLMFLIFLLLGLFAFMFNLYKNISLKD